MEKESFGECIKWLRKVDEESIKDFDTFCSTFIPETPITTAATTTTVTTTINHIRINKEKDKNKEIEFEDESYEMSGDADSCSNSEEEINLHVDDFYEGKYSNNSFMFLNYY